MSAIVKLKEVDRELVIKTGDGVYTGSGENRRCLTVSWGSNNGKTALAIGINPSKANDKRSDKTLTTLGRFLEAYGYSQLTMLNLFESYSTDQQGIIKTSQTVFSDFGALFDAADSIFIVWGVDRKNYQDEKSIAANFLKKYDSKVFCIKNPNGSFPIHPSRMKYTDEIAKFELF